MSDERVKVAVGLPFYRQIEGPTAACLMELAAASNEYCRIMPITSAGAYIEQNRNSIVKFALGTGIDFDYLFWVDGDMVFPPETLLQLLARERDIVGCNYRQRMPPYMFVGAYADLSDRHVMEPGTHLMRHLPTGLLLTRFKIYREMAYPWFKPGLEHEARDDVYFCQEATKLGYEIWCDHDLTFKVRHLADQVIPWFSADQVVRRQEGMGLTPQTGNKEADERMQVARQAFDHAAD